MLKLADFFFSNTFAFLYKIIARIRIKEGKGSDIVEVL